MISGLIHINQRWVVKGDNLHEETCVKFQKQDHKPLFIAPGFDTIDLPVSWLHGKSIYLVRKTGGGIPDRVHRESERTGVVMDQKWGGWRSSLVKRPSVIMLMILAILPVAPFLLSSCRKGGGEGYSLLVVTKGPYLQNVTKTSIVIMWETSTGTPTLLEYGTGPTRISNLANVSHHSVELSGLSPGITCKYRVSIDGVGYSWTEWATFCTSLPAQQPFRFAVYGDSRTQTEVHSAVVQAIFGNSPDIVLHTGDLVSSGDTYPFWEEFFTPAAPLMRTTPVFPVIGNHDGHTYYYDLFSLPGNEQWYAFTYGCARFIGIDTNVDFSQGSAQYSWLVNELQSSEYTASLWQFVCLHHPPYTSGEGHLGDTEVQTWLVPLYEQYGVEVVFAGHNHNYERSYKNGVHHIVTGGGGAPLYGFHPDPFTYNPYSQVRKSVYHHCIFDVTPGRVTMKAVANDLTIFDSFSL